MRLGMGGNAAGPAAVPTKPLKSSSPGITARDAPEPGLFCVASVLLGWLFWDDGAMDEATRHEIHLGTTGMNIHDLVRELNANLGTTVVQTMAGVKDRTSPFRWAKPDGPEPGRTSSPA